MESWYWAIALGCIVFGWIGGYICHPRAKKIGALRVDHSDPDGPYFFMVLTVQPKTIMAQKRVLLDVEVENVLPRK